MITASHNPPEDNGVKLVDPMGEMLEASWEVHATSLANATSAQNLAEAYHSLTTELNVDTNTPAKVMYARDTRASGPHLISALIEGLNAVGVIHTDFKLLTTPQLHYITRCLNTIGTPFEYGEPTEIGYYEKTARSFKAALGDKKVNGSLTVDCANGVGGPKLKELLQYLPTSVEGGIDIKVVNDDVVRPERLNHQVCTQKVLDPLNTQYIVVWRRLRQDRPASPTSISGSTVRKVLLFGWRCRPHSLLLSGRRRNVSPPGRRSHSHPSSSVHW